MKRSSEVHGRPLIKLVLALLLVALLAGCTSAPATTTTASTAASSEATTQGTTQATTQATTAATTTASTLLDGGVTNPTGYSPIVTEPITLRAAIIYGAHMGDFTTYQIWKDIEEKTGIKLELDILADTEKVNLMFASRDYPDIAFRLDPQNTMVMEDRKSVV